MYVPYHRYLTKSISCVILPPEPLAKAEILWYEKQTLHHLQLTIF